MFKLLFASIVAVFLFSGCYYHDYHHGYYQHGYYHPNYSKELILIKPRSVYCDYGNRCGY
jgi:sterol desaturase/sphingolipid hydroxylase (fatty acid hydroxylase superfamily)